MGPRLAKLSVFVIGATAICLLMVGVVLASQCTWCDEMTNSLTFYKASYPTSNFDPYQEKIAILQEAFGRGDQKSVKAETAELFKMLRTRAYGINDVAADELFSHWQMLTPTEELKVSAPVEECTSTSDRLVCGSLTIDRIEDLREYRPENQDNMGSGG